MSWLREMRLAKMRSEYMSTTEQQRQLDEEISRWQAASARSRRRWSAFGIWTGIAGIFALWCAIAVVDCNALRVPDDDATHVLEENGVTDVQLRGIDFGGCEQGEESREFDAKRDGRRVHGTVCCGIVRKACTVRWR